MLNIAPDTRLRGLTSLERTPEKFALQFSSFQERDERSSEAG
jgi:hypothetical protein